MDKIYEIISINFKDKTKHTSEYEKQKKIKLSSEMQNNV